MEIGILNSTSKALQPCVPIEGKFNPYEIYGQLATASSLSVLTSALLGPLGIPLMVTHMLAGYLAGFIYPYDPRRNYRTNQVLDTYATIGVIFHLFLIGVQVNPPMIRRGGKKGIAVGISFAIFPFLLVIISGNMIKAIFHIKQEAFRNFLRVGLFECFSSLPVVVSLLNELKMINMEFSQVASVASVISGGLSFLGMLVYIFVFIGIGFKRSLIVLFCMALLVLIMLYAVRPWIRWMINEVPEGQKLSDTSMYAMFLAVIATVAITAALGNSHLLGPFLLGLVIPTGPPLGSSLVERLEFFNTWMMLPLFYTSRGLLIDTTGITLQYVLLNGSAILIVFAAKFMAAFFPAIYYGMSYKNSILTGLAMTIQGFSEIMVYKFVRHLQILPEKTYVIMVYAIGVNGAIVVPLIRYLYNSMMTYKVQNVRTIQHLVPNTDLRVIACIYEEVNVPSIMEFLKAINPTKENPVNLNILHFVELVGHAPPAIISHKMHKKSDSTTAASKHIINVFKNFEESDRRRISLNPYTVVSAYMSMDDYACVLALQQRCCIIILPYHRVLSRDITNKNIRAVNCNILEKAPCSVGILIDRGLVGGIKSVLENWSSYHVAVVFLGGADDREALALGERMSGHPTIELTVFRFHASSDDSKSATGDAKEEILDREIVRQFKMNTSYNNRVRYMEKEVSDGVEVGNVLELFKDTYQLVIIGRRHDENSPLMLGIKEWEESSEIGLVGDTFVKYGYGRNATILVVQQQTKVEETSLQFLLDEETMQSR